MAPLAHPTRNARLKAYLWAKFSLVKKPQRDAEASFVLNFGLSLIAADIFLAAYQSRLKYGLIN